ncbi:MAG: ASKHA domain-containing protein [Lachnospiraceae bacterium]|nr:ASKHA domain-containing protein [Lachnospiraceae bacterium]
MKYPVTFVRENMVYEAEEGMTVLEVERKAGLTPDAPCGGNGKCGKCRVLIDGILLAACQVLVRGALCVDTGGGKEGTDQILTEGVGRRVTLDPGELPEDVERPFLAAVDLGSTSVVAYLLDGKTGATLAVRSMMNPQRQYGADVVMRASYAMEHGAEALSSCIRRLVSEMIRELARECGGSQEDVVRIVMVGNSCMHHLFLEIPVDSLVLAPYEPKVKDAVSCSAQELGILAYPQARICWLPNIGGFVGADTVGCILATHMEEREKMTLMIDIGTNGEMVLGNRKTGLMACSTAAGPAFEGAKISCGMRGSTGAIDHVHLDGADHPVFHVIGEGEPIGVCGSGLLDAASCLLKCGVIDESGQMKDDWYFTKNVSLIQQDIRELQLAKAAIAAGIRILCAKKGIMVGDIEEVLLAGAFGNYLDPESACDIGMLPEELRGRIIPVGNAAGEGARIAALNQGEYERSRVLAREVEFVELAREADFQDIYVDELEFPEQK